jgi:hypothetical protein
MQISAVYLFLDPDPFCHVVSAFSTNSKSGSLPNKKVTVAEYSPSIPYSLVSAGSSVENAPRTQRLDAESALAKQFEFENG